MQAGLDDEPVVFFDPNTLNAEGTTAIMVYSFSEDAKWFAYALSDAGSDWMRIRIKNVETGEHLPETLTKVKFTGISWTHDNLGFFYSVRMLTASHESHKLRNFGLNDLFE